MAKVAFLKSRISQRGGLEKYTLRLADSFAKSGHEVRLLTTDASTAIRGPYEVVDFGCKWPLSLLQLMHFDSCCKRYLKEHPADVVFGLDRNFCPQTHYRAGNGCHAAYLERRRQHDSWFKTNTFAFNPLHRLILAMERATFESPHLKRLFVNSHMVEREILHHYPKLDRQKIAVVHNGVQWQEQQKPFEEGLQMRQEIIKQLHLDPDCYQLLFVGHEYERKGLTLLLQALALLPDKKFQLSVLGRERRVEPFVAKARRLGLQERVRFFGPVNEVKAFYSAADTLVVPSLYDPFANVTVEALSMGLFVISSSANGGSEVISPEIGSIFEDLKNPEQLSICLQKSMHHPKTEESAYAIRQKVAHLDFTNQLSKILKATIIQQ